MSCHAMPCHVMLCYVILYYIWSDLVGFYKINGSLLEARKLDSCPLKDARTKTPTKVPSLWLNKEYGAITEHGLPPITCILSQKFFTTNF